MLAAVAVAGLVGFGARMALYPSGHLAVEGDQVVYRVRNGVRLAGRGRVNSYVAKWPAFPTDSGFHQQVARDLEERARSDGGEFATLDRAELWESMWESSAVGRHECEVTCGTALIADRFVSLVCTNSAYTGGAHGNTHYVVWNYGEQAGQAVPVELADLFDPQADWPQRLSELCLGDLRRQQASNVLNGLITNVPPDALESFAVMPEGLQFYFAPYAVGCYAEGSYTVNVPWHLIRVVVPTNSVVAPWAHRQES